MTSSHREFPHREFPHRDFPHRVCAVTGAASGIGRALALDLARRGCSLALCDVDEDGLAKTAADAATEDVLTQVVDVADREAVYGFADAATERFGEVHAVFNNAGVALSQTVAESTWEDYEWLMGINFWGVLYGTKAFLPQMLERDDGAIVNVSSVFGLIGVPTQSAYNAAKFAVRGFTEALRLELRDTNVLVSCVHPGGIKTNIVRRSRFYQDVDGNTDHAAQVEQFDKIAKTTAEKAAETILEGVEKRSPRILIGADAHLIDSLVRMFPIKYAGVFEKVVAQLSK